MDVVLSLPLRERNGWAILLLCAGLLLTGQLAASESGSDLLTPSERAWLAEHPDIVLGSDQNWTPCVKIQNDGTVAGIEADLLARINALTGANIRLVLGPWADIVAQAERGELDGLAVSAAHPERAAQFLFSASPYSSSRFIYARGGKISPLRTMADLADKQVGVLKGNLAEQKLLARWPGIIVVEKASNPELAFALASGEVDAAISGITLLQIIRQELLADLGIAFAIPDSEVKLLYFIRREHPELLSIINKALAAISPGEIQAILGKWGATLVVPSAALSLTDAERARASAGRIELKIQDQAVLLMVSDNGQGFPSAMDQLDAGGGGYGLFSVRERLALLGGSRSIVSDAAGARVMVRAPLTSRVEEAFVNHDLSRIRPTRASPSHDDHRSAR